MFEMIRPEKLSKALMRKGSYTLLVGAGRTQNYGVAKLFNVAKSWAQGRYYSTTNVESMKIDNKHIHNMYKLNEIYYNNLKIINDYDEYFNLVIKNEYFKDYSKIPSRFMEDGKKLKSSQSMSDNLNSNQSIERGNNNLCDDLEEINNDNNSKNIIISNDLQILYFGSYENNVSILLFEKFRTIIEKNRKLQFFFIDVNVCPQGSYNCDVTYVPCICLIYKNHIFRKKLEVNYEYPIDEKYINEFLNEVQQNIDYFHTYNNKFIYKLKKQSNYLNTKYIDIDNQNVHKENWNTF
ncbi:conserved Plasmodium protein, unknown function [Plasmodium ovale]|uniref:Thioredoxin-like protein n=2 Tax=Plasmodium ovale TaxID=36330 RepID=A0A1D3U7F4_PLAOA|nr:conserved Plasmodium protein, unknown function [Plasmodium ovale]